MWCGFRIPGGTGGGFASLVALGRWGVGSGADGHWLGKRMGVSGAASGVSKEEPLRAAGCGGEGTGAVALPDPQPGGGAAPPAVAVRWRARGVRPPAGGGNREIGGKILCLEPGEEPPARLRGVLGTRSARSEMAVASDGQRVPQPPPLALLGSSSQLRWEPQFMSCQPQFIRGHPGYNLHQL